MSFYTSLTGLNAASSQLTVTSNNIANVGTTGFKRSRADFGDIFATSPLQTPPRWSARCLAQGGDAGIQPGQHPFLGELAGHGHHR